MNSRRGLINILSSTVRQLVSLALGIVVPRLVLVSLGSESNGLLNTINQILAYVALLEAGVGTASLQALYGPVAKQDRQSISCILSATNRFYKRTGTIYLTIVLALSIIFPLTLESELSYLTVMLVVLFSGLPGVINYYFQGKFKILLQAEGKDYIITNLATIVNVLTNVAKIVLLVNGFDVVALQFMYLIFNIAQMLFISVYMKRHYKWLDLAAAPDFDSISQSKNVLVHQISGLIFSNTDSLLLTYFGGLRVVSVYSMYSMLFGMIDNTISNFTGANFILGQTFHTDRKRYMLLHDAFELYYTTLTFCLFCIANIFILPFMRLYTAGVTDINYIDTLLPYLFIATYLLSRSRTASMQAINFANHFKQTQWHAVTEAIINLSVSILCAWQFGIHGVLFGTIAALLFRSNAMILYANRKILNRNPWITYRRWLLNLAIFIFVTIVTKYVFSFIALDSYIAIVFWAIVCCIVIIPIFFVTVSLVDRDVYHFAKSLIAPYIKAAVHKLRHSSNAN